MHRFVQEHSNNQGTFTRTHYKLTAQCYESSEFAEALAVYFVQNWMNIALPQMLQVWKQWDGATDEEKRDYFAYLESSLLTHGKLLDNPDKGEGHTGPIATFGETILRWLRQHFAPTQLLVEPPVPQPAGDGKIDFIEITGFPGDYASMAVRLWEVKATDSQVSYQNSKVYTQLDDYPKRFYYLANHIGARCNTNDVALKKFMRDMAPIVRNHRPQAHYGVFVTYDENITQKISFVPDLHNHPRGCKGSPHTHTLAMLAIPDFRQVRLSVWRALHLT
jgi:hypothetical protein